MDNLPRLVTQADLREHGLSDYMVRQLVKNLGFSKGKRGLRLYTTLDVVAAIHAKVAQSRTRKATREKLQDVLVWLQGASNIIKVDFLQNLSLEERVETLKARIEAAEISMASGLLKDYAELQKTVQAVLAGSKVMP